MGLFIFGKGSPVGYDLGLTVDCLEMKICGPNKDVRAIGQGAPASCWPAGWKPALHFQGNSAPVSEGWNDLDGCRTYVLQDWL